MIVFAVAGISARATMRNELSLPGLRALTASLLGMTASFR